MGRESGILTIVGGAKVGVREAIRADVALVLERVEAVRRELAWVESMARRNLVRLDAGEQVGNVVTAGGDAVDHACLSLVRRIDHMSALVEVAYANEGGG